MIKSKENLLTSESENESMEMIYRYVKEITDEMINKVCLQSERTNSKSSTREDINMNKNHD